MQEPAPANCGSLKVGKIKYGQEFRGTPAQNRERRRSPAATIHYRFNLSSERAHHIEETANVNIISKELKEQLMASRRTDGRTDHRSQDSFDFDFTFTAVKTSNLTRCELGGIYWGKGDWLFSHSLFAFRNLWFLSLRYISFLTFRSISHFLLMFPTTM
jgi:hypothetical protein